MAWKERVAGRSGQQVLTGANFALYTLVVIAIIIVANWFVSNHDKRWDMTPNKRYSLSAQTHKILKELNKDVTIYVFDQERSFGERRDVLGMYESASNRVKVKYVDPNRQPALAREFNIRNFGTIVVSAGERLLRGSRLAMGESRVTTMKKPRRSAVRATSNNCRKIRRRPPPFSAVVTGTPARPTT